jgi:hypothetical protein
MCHKNAEQVNHLIDRLSTENRDFYVHVDSKSQIFDEINWSEHVIPAKRRIDVKWGTISQCDAEISLIETALDSGKQYNYYWLISGQDFPIKTNEYIDAFLEENKGANFIDIIDMSLPAHLNKVKRNELYYPNWMVKRNLFSKVLRRACVMLTGGENKTFSCFKRKNITGLDFRFGSQWFCLTQECIDYVYGEIRNKPEIYNFFKNSVVPDECFMQTIIANGPFVKSVKARTVYVDWSEMKPNPKILGNDDIELLKASKMLLARKFDIVTPEIEALSNNFESDC